MTQIEDIIFGAGFDAVYDYRREQNCIHPSFKILYDSCELRDENSYKQIETCAFDFLTILGNLELKEDNKELDHIEKEDEELDYIIEKVQVKDGEGVKKIMKKICTLIQSENNISLGPHIANDMKMDRHLFYKTNLAPKFKLEIEKYNLTGLSRQFKDKKGVVHYFKDEELNTIMNELDMPPDFVCVFVVRQIEYGAGDKVFGKMFERLGEEVYSLNTKYYLKK